MISPQMQEQIAILTQSVTPLEATWPERRAAYDALSDVYPALPDVVRDEIELGGVPTVRFTPPGVDGARAILYFHGGGYCIGSTRSHAMIVTRLAKAAGCTLYFPLYRLAPEHDFPVPVEDCFSAWQGLLATGMAPERVAFCGDSAGGGLCFSIMQMARDRGVALPACAAAISPWSDMEGQGTWRAGDPTRDAFLLPQELELFVEGFIGGSNLRHPLAAPMYGAMDRLPPVLIQVSASELLYDDAVRLAAGIEASGGSVETQVAEAGTPHVWHHMVPDVPESVEAIETAGAFMARHTT
jgi:monoterpene epsilon-lactone hydrolase